MKIVWKLVSIPLLTICLMISAGWALRSIGASHDVNMLVQKSSTPHLKAQRWDRTFQRNYTSISENRTTATVAIAHFAPFTDARADTSVTVRVDGADVLTDFTFAERISGISLPTGTHTIELVGVDSDTPILATTATVEADKDYTIAAIGGANGWPISLYVVENDNRSVASVGRVRFTHFAPFDSAVAATQIDICTEAGTPVTGLTNIGYQDTSGYLELTPGIYKLNVAVAGTNCSTVVQALPEFSLISGQFADIFAIGLPTNAELPLQLSQTGLAARVAVGHFAPFASEFISTAVDIRVANSEVISNFTFGRLTPYLFLPLGELPVEVIPSGTDQPVLTGTASITGFVDFTFAVVGDTVNQPLELIRTVDDNATPPTEGQGRLVTQHLAPFAANQTATVLDLCEAIGDPPLLSGLAYKSTSVLALNVGSYKTFVAPQGTNCSQTLIDLPEFIIGEGRIAKAVVIGDQSNTPFIFATIPNIEARHTFLPITAADQTADE